MASGDFFSWIGDAARSAGDFLFGDDGLDLGDVVDLGKSAFSGTKSKANQASNAAMAQSLMSKAMDGSKVAPDAMGGATKSTIAPNSDVGPIFRDRGSNDPWLSNFRRLVEGTKTI